MWPTTDARAGRPLACGPGAGAVGTGSRRLVARLTSAGAPGSQTNRVSDATVTSLFVDSEIRSGKWIFTPGIRFEDIDMRRLDYSTSDPSRADGPTRVRENSAQVVIPGVGALYRLNEDWVEVEAGDFMWLRAFCPQACYAGGPGRFRYLLYKDVNRHMPLRPFGR